MLKGPRDPQLRERWGEQEGGQQERLESGAPKSPAHPAAPFQDVLPAALCHRDAWPFPQAVTAQRHPGHQNKCIPSAARQLPSEGEIRAHVKDLCFVAQLALAFSSSCLPVPSSMWEFFLLFHGTGVLKGQEHIQGQTAMEKLVPRSLHVPSRDECKPESLTSTPPSLLLISSTLRPQPMSVLLGDPRDPYQSTCDGQLFTRFHPPLGPVLEPMGYLLHAGRMWT